VLISLTVDFAADMVRSPDLLIIHFDRLCAAEGAAAAAAAAALDFDGVRTAPLR
jgi:hypothetical protein